MLISAAVGLASSNSPWWLTIWRFGANFFTIYYSTAKIHTHRHTNTFPLSASYTFTHKHNKIWTICRQMGVKSSPNCSTSDSYHTASPAYQDQWSFISLLVARLGRNTQIHTSTQNTQKWWLFLFKLESYIVDSWAVYWCVNTTRTRLSSQDSSKNTSDSFDEYCTL